MSYEEMMNYEDNLTDLDKANLRSWKYIPYEGKYGWRYGKTNPSSYHRIVDRCNSGWVVLTENGVLEIRRDQNIKQDSILHPKTLAPKVEKIPTQVYGGVMIKSCGFGVIDLPENHENICFTKDEIKFEGRKVRVTIEDVSEDD